MAAERIVLVLILSFMCWTHGKKVNIALKKPTSTLLGHFLNWTSDKAVDGNNNIRGEGGTCFHGAGSPSDWTVDLGQKYQLYGIRVYIRNRFQHRIADSIIYLDQDFNNRTCYTFPSNISDNPTNVTCNGTGRYVSIRNPGNGHHHTDALNICEVEIYVCSNGTYGISCATSCGHCASPTCDRWTGFCNGDCHAGYRGNKCDTVCSNGTYGINCTNTCGHCASQPCDRMTGVCSGDCVAGYRRNKCDAECKKQHYGSSCSSLCVDRNCYGNSTCDHVTGSCDKGCQAGWHGIDCRQFCNNGTFGINCTNTCGHCASPPCDGMNGVCNGDCVAGYRGNKCDTECDKKHYGNNCSSLCTDRNCYGNSICDHVTGSCDKGCQAGWNGIDCRQSCDEEHYGPNCTWMCSTRHCEGNSSCNHTTGWCDQECQTGWSGTDCTHNNTGPLRITRGLEAHSVYENVALDEDSRKPTAAAAIELIQQNGQAGGSSGDCDSRSVDTLEEEEEDYDCHVRLEEDTGAPERNYYNLDNINRDHLISVSQLKVRVRELEEKPEQSEEEFQQLPDTFLHPYDESQKPGNKSKNRFKGYYPYNYNRVVLHDGGKGDYINASYLDGYNIPKRFIAAQGPYKNDIVEDFWRMIWQEKCQLIVMVTELAEGGKMKCLRYWPEKGSSTFGDVTVTMETERRLADYTIRRLIVQHGKETKKHYVTQFHFTSWPDHGVPDTSCLLQYMRKINSTSGQQKHPTIVHCSAGIGRTGTYIAVESLVSQAMTEDNVDVVSFVCNMRSQRKNMIQTKEQYLFIYQAVLAAVVEGDTSLDADLIRQIDLGHVADVQMGNSTVQQHLETMTTYPESLASDAIITVPSYTSRAGFFVFMSQPEKEELWSRIYDTDSRTLVTWELANKSYFPSSDQSVSTSRLTVSMTSSTVLSDTVTLTTLQLQRKDNKEGVTIHHYHVTGSARDPSVSVLIDSLLQWTGQSECESTTIVSLSISETRLLILLVNITSRLQDDGKVDVISNMRRLQSLLGGPRFTVDDVRLCVEFSQRRLETLGTYANISDV